VIRALGRLPAGTVVAVSNKGPVKSDIQRHRYCPHRDAQQFRPSASPTLTNQDKKERDS
jgi:hypothetical protein